MTHKEYYDLCKEYWKHIHQNWFKNTEMRKHFKAHKFGWPGRNYGYVEAAEDVLEPAKIEVWKIGGRNWTVKPGKGIAFKKMFPNAKRRVKK